MKAPRASWLPTLLVAALALSMASCSSLAVAAATVNGDKITETQVESELDTLRADPIFGEALRRDPDTRGQRRREILKELIYQQVAQQQARRLHVRVTRSQVDRLITQTARARGTTVGSLLKTEHLSMDEARKLAGRGVLRFVLIDKVVQSVAVNEKTIRDVYKGQQERFVEVHLERITVKTAKDASDVVHALTSGSTFSTVARLKSTDGLAKSGGDLGYAPLTALDQQTQSAISSVVEGGVTDPVQTTSGWQIYRLVDRRTKPFNEVASEIRLALTQDERDRRFDSWLASRVRASKVVVNPKYGRLDKSQGDPTVVPSSGTLAP